MRVLFVCTGNTCRSPMAEAMARRLDDGNEYASAGRHADEGAPAAPNAVADRARARDASRAAAHARARGLGGQGRRPERGGHRRPVRRRRADLPCHGRAAGGADPVTMSETQTVTEQKTELQIGYAGTSIPRKEDRRLVQGEGVFADDVKRHGMGYVHFVRSPYAHAKIVSVDVSAAEELEGVYGTLTPDEVAALTDPFFELTTAPGSQIKDFALAVGERAPRRRAGRRGRRPHPRRRARRGRPGRGRVRAAAGARRRAQGAGSGRARPPRRRRHERRLVGHVRLGRRRRRAQGRRPRDQDLRAPLRPLLVDAARVLGRPGRVRPRHRAVHDPLEPPDARRGRDLDGPGAARAARPAPLRVAGHRRRLRQQDHDAHVPHRLLPARAQAAPPDPVDGVAHRPALGERARQRALVPRRSRSP